MSEQLWHRCSFYNRTPAEGGYRYDRIEVRGPRGDDKLHVPAAPLVGDRIFLTNDLYVVLARQFAYASWGSHDWPLVELHALHGPLVDLIVEPASGLFVDEIWEPAFDLEDGPSTEKRGMR
jgi:hypothetical protein